MRWKECRVVAFDTETSSLDPEEDRICSFSFLVYAPGGVQVVEEYSGLCDTDGVRIHPAATKAHGLTNASVAGYPSFDRRLPEVLDFWSKYTTGEDFFMLAYNAPFDLAFLCSALRRTGLTMELDPLRVVDPLIFARLHSRYNNRLEDVVKRMGLTQEAFHDASADARMATRTLFAMRDLPDTLDALLQMQDNGIRRWEIATGRTYRDTLFKVDALEGL